MAKIVSSPKALLNNGSQHHMHPASLGVSHLIFLKIRSLVQLELLEVLLHFLAKSITVVKNANKIRPTSLGQGFVARQVGKFSGCSTHNLCWKITWARHLVWDKLHIVHHTHLYTSFSELLCHRPQLFLPRNLQHNLGPQSSKTYSNHFHFSGLTLCMLSRSAKYCWTDSSLPTVGINYT